MRNREELRQKVHDRESKTMCHEREKNIIFRKGGKVRIRIRVKMISPIGS
jgi:hypothetical protein